VSFGAPKNPHTEFITFDVIDIIYPYNAIFVRGLLNTFEAALYYNQQEARNIEKGFTPGHKNVHFL
jgi:hypothetical protein